MSDAGRQWEDGRLAGKGIFFSGISLGSRYFLGKKMISVSNFLFFIQGKNSPIVFVIQRLETKAPWDLSG